MAKPIKKFSAGAIQVSVWENEGREGKQFYSVSLDKRYKDKNEQWKSTGSLKAKDLPNAVLALNKAYEYLTLKDDNVKLTDLM
ncbi:MAG: hypothetical protein QXK06_01025 [Candidatus Diapherotrites archaeon]